MSGTLDPADTESNAQHQSESLQCPKCNKQANQISTHEKEQVRINLDSHHTRIKEITKWLEFKCISCKLTFGVPETQLND